MMPVAGNIQSARKNCLSQNYPFRKDDDDPEDEECDLPPTEYDDNYAYRRYDNKPSKFVIPRSVMIDSNAFFTFSSKARFSARAVPQEGYSDSDETSPGAV